MFPEIQTIGILAVTAVCLLAGIPLLLLVYGGVRLLFNVPRGSQGRGIGLTFLALWIIGILVSIVLFFQILFSFKNQAKVEEVQELEPTAASMMYIDMNEGVFVDALDDSFDKKYSLQIHHNGQEIELFRFDQLLFQPIGQSHFIGIPRLDIKRSMTGEPHVKLTRYANGATQNEAEERARSISYSFKQKDSLLLLNPAFEIDDETLFRDQRLRIEVYIPQNTIVDISSSSERLTYNLANISRTWINQSIDTWDWELGGKRWIMLNDGLYCINCNDTSLDDLDSLQRQRVKMVMPNL